MAVRLSTSQFSFTVGRLSFRKNMKELGKFILFLIQGVAALLDASLKALVSLAKIVMYIAIIPAGVVLASLFLLLSFVLVLFMPVGRIEKLRHAFSSKPKIKKKRKLHPVFSDLKTTSVN